MSGEKRTTGPVTMVIAADPDQKIVIIQLGSTVNRLEFGPEEALHIASTIMHRASIASGKSIADMVAERAIKNEAPQSAKT